MKRMQRHLSLMLVLAVVVVPCPGLRLRRQLTCCWPRPGRWKGGG